MVLTEKIPEIQIKKKKSMETKEQADSNPKDLVIS